MTKTEIEMMSKKGVATIAVLFATLVWTPLAQAGPPKDPPTKCAPDAVLVGSVCIDKYEASVWRIPAVNGAGKSNASLIKKVRNGKATVLDLAAGNATQLGVWAHDYSTCDYYGNGCKDDIYAVSLPGVWPSAFITWFQANIACANAGKRLPSNAEWQAAVTGTPNPEIHSHLDTCTVWDPSPVQLTGSKSGCVSAFGAFDMVGNVWEWVADWVPRSTTCGSWGGSDDQCLAGAATSGEPGALMRGGSILASHPMRTGPLAVRGDLGPLWWSSDVGFRCAR